MSEIDKKGVGKTQPPAQLTELAVDEFNARGATKKVTLSINVRAMSYNQQAVRRRQLSRDPLG